MLRRIAAALLALTILASVLPSGVWAEDGHVYDIGETTWVTGIGKKPSAQTVENGYWAESMVNGEQVKEPGCTKEIHEHTPEECYDAVEGLICQKEEHTARRHALVCSFLESKYQWVVLEKEIINPNPGPGGDGSGGDELESDGSGINDPLGYVNFVVENVDPEGNPIQGSKFLLVEKDGENFAYLENQSAAEELQEKMEQQALEQQEKLKELQEQGDADALNAYIEQANAQNRETVTALNELDNELLAKTTGADGKVYFRSLEKYLAENKKVDEGGKDTWYLCLVQAEVPDAYRPNNDEAEVKVVRNGENDYELYIDGVLYEEGEESFSFVNEILNLKLLVRMRFVDQDGREVLGDALNGVTGSVTVKGPEPYREAVQLPNEDTGWQRSLTMLEPGTYTVEDTTVSGAPEGYTLERTEWEILLPKTKAELEGEAASDGEKLSEVTLGKSPTAATVLVTCYCTEKVEAFNLIARAVDKSGNSVEGARFALENENGSIPGTVSGNEVLFTINPAQCDLGTYTLTQTQIPDGYQLMEEHHYTLEVMENRKAELFDGNKSLHKFSTEEGAAAYTVDFTHVLKEKPTEYTIIVKSVDEAGKDIPAGKFSLSGMGITARESGSECIYTIDMETCIEDDYTIEEVAAPYGYNRSTDKYTVTVKNGEVVISKGGIIQRMFTRNNLADTGKETIIFTHSKKTAQISLTSDIYADVDPLCWNYRDTVNEFLSRTHKFILEWTDANGVRQKETMELGNETKAFNAKLAYGTPYEVYPVDPSGYNYEFNGGASNGIVGDNNALHVEILYDVNRGEGANLYFTKVDSSTGEPLAGAKFSLRDENGQEIAIYTTKEGGAIDIENLIDMPGHYTLKETKAPDEYDVLRKPVEIEVRTWYRTERIGGQNVQVQYLDAVESDVVHRSVTYHGTDGTYWIKNTASGDSPKTGDSFNLQLWTGIMVISMSGLILIFAKMRKKQSGK